MKIIIIGFILFSALVCWSSCALPKSAEEQRLEDEEQMKYLTEYKNKRSMVKY